MVVSTHPADDRRGLDQQVEATKEDHPPSTHDARRQTWRGRSMKKYQVALLGVVALAIVAVPAIADHAWANYHWARAANPVSLTLGSNFATSVWDSYLVTSRNDWNVSSVLDLSIVSGTTTPRRCRASTGNIEVCADTYGNNGWLGLASISVSGDHITKATAKMNDTYYCPGCVYDTTAWRNLVMCQEIGHTFGLDHQDESNTNPNLGTCMDYTNNPGSNQHPNAHDYEQLETIYAHLDGGGGGCKGKNCGAGAPAAMSLIEQDGPGQWGKLVARSHDGHSEVYVLDFGNGHQIITHVLWAYGEEDLEDLK